MPDVLDPTSPDWELPTIPRLKVARILGVTPQYVDALVKRGRLPRYRTSGRRTVFRGCDVAALAQPDKPQRSEIDRYVDQIVANAPKLTEAQRAVIAAALSDSKAALAQ